jgi:hypothetical protein
MRRPVKLVQYQTAESVVILDQENDSNSYDSTILVYAPQPVSHIQPQQQLIFGSLTGKALPSSTLQTLLNRSRLTAKKDVVPIRPLITVLNASDNLKSALAPQFINVETHSAANSSSGGSGSNFLGGAIGIFGPEAGFCAPSTLELDHQHQNAPYNGTNFNHPSKSFKPASLVYGTMTGVVKQ